MDEQLVIHKPNQSFNFILPLFEIKNTLVVINTYIGTISRTGFDNKLYVLVKNSTDELDKHKNKVNQYIIDGNIMYELEVPKQFLADYNNFLLGKYSEYSEKAKEVIINKVARNSGKHPKETMIYSILYKTEKRRKQLETDLDVKLPKGAELASIFNIKTEVYDG